MKRLRMKGVGPFAKQTAAVRPMKPMTIKGKAQPRKGQKVSGVMGDASIGPLPKVGIRRYLVG